MIPSQMGIENQPSTTKNRGGEKGIKRISHERGGVEEFTKQN